MSMTIDVFASRKEAEDFIIAKDLKKFGEPRIREVVLSDKTIYRVNINNSGYKAIKISDLQRAAQQSAHPTRAGVGELKSPAM